MPASRRARFPHRTQRSSSRAFIPHAYLVQDGQDRRLVPLQPLRSRAPASATKHPFLQGFVSHCGHADAASGNLDAEIEHAPAVPPHGTPSQSSRCLLSPRADPDAYCRNPRPRHGTNLGEASKTVAHRHSTRKRARACSRSGIKRNCGAAESHRCESRPPVRGSQSALGLRCVLDRARDPLAQPRVRRCQPRRGDDRFDLGSPRAHERVDQARRRLARR